jgi:hypothetical protein
MTFFKASMCQIALGRVGNGNQVTYSGKMPL